MFMIFNNSGSNNELDCGEVATTQQWRRATTQVFRDPSAWYHLVLAFDSTQATAANRVKIYVNGTQVTSFSTSVDPSLNYSSIVNTATAHSIGRVALPTGFYLDGYFTEVNFIDGQQLTPSSFGSTNAITGVWQPAKYTGTYGTNGFYLPFTDNSALTTASNAGLGKDFSGNANYWVTNNISITAGATYDSMTDVPTLTSATAANFAVLNPIGGSTGTNITVTNGNLTATTPIASVSSFFKIPSSISVSSGKWYFEDTVTALDANNWAISIAGTPPLNDSSNQNGLLSGEVTYVAKNNSSVEQIFDNGSSTYTGGSGASAGDVIGVAFDVTNLTVQFYRNNTAVSTAQAITSATFFYISAIVRNNTTASIHNINFGQRPFSYTPPSGFVALNTYNLPASTVPNGASYMAATLYTGTGASLTVANTVGSASFQPDWVWIKSRSAATDHKLTDSVRGVTKGLISNTTAAETTDTTGLTAFGSTGFTVGANTTYNNSGATYVAWNWKAGGTAVTNTSGSITSSVSANTTSGFSIIGYTGTGVMSQTIGHGLGVSPNVVIFKCRTTGVTDWNMYAPAISVFTRLKLNTTDADFGTFPITVSSTLITLPAINNVAFNSTGNDYIVYAWAAIKGFSAFGSYTGNGSTDGPFIYTGFRPRYILIKRTDGVGSWVIIDSSRNGYNANNDDLYANLSDAEADTNRLDILSNGWKDRNTYGSSNGSGMTYIYAAFAENPFQNALAR